MKIVIDIPEELYKNAISGKFHTPTFYEAIQNGTPLPKGHGRLIDADAIIADEIMAKATERMKYPVNLEYMECVRLHMKLVPTIIEADTEPMYYPQVDGITPTVVAERVGDKE